MFLDDPPMGVAYRRMLQLMGAFSEHSGTGLLWPADHPIQRHSTQSVRGFNLETSRVQQSYPLRGHRGLGGPPARSIQASPSPHQV
jgi:hypothetical protein